MPYCPKCGKQIDEGTRFCPQCGEQIQAAPGVIYRRGAERWGAGHVLALIFGGLIILVGVGLLAGGGVLRYGQNLMSDSEGYIMSRPTVLQVNSYAIVQSNVDVNIDDMYMMRPISKDAITIKVQGKANDPSKQIFIGILRGEDASGYFGSVNYDLIVEYPWRYSQWAESSQVRYTNHPGGAPSQSPTSKTIWVASVSGSGTQTLTWTPRSGDYWFVVMNSDGSPKVDVTMQLGAKIGFLSTIGNIILVAGVITVLVGALIVYYGALRRP